MKNRDVMDNDKLFEEVSDPPDLSIVVREVAGEGEGEVEEDEEGEEQGVDGEDGDEGEENEGEEVDDEMEEGEDDSTVTFEGVMNLNVVDGNTSDVQIYQELERIEYEARAKKKRKCDEFANQGIQGQGVVEKPRQKIGATLEEVKEVMTLGDRRRRWKDKKRGRQKGSRNNLSPEITKKLGDANLHYAHGNYEDAIRLLGEVVLLAPNLPDPYHTLGLVFNSKGDNKRAMDSYMIAAFLGPKNTSLWKRLVTWSIEQGNIGQAWYCITKAIAADPTDVTLIYRRASLFMEARDFLKAAESYEQIVRVSYDDVEALKMATMLYNQCGLYERSISILEEYLNVHPTDADLAMVDLLASSYMARNDYTKALQRIEQVETVCSPGEFPLYLTIKKGICHAHLEDMDKAKICFKLLERGSVKHQVELILAVANSFMELRQYGFALKYFLMVEGCVSHNGIVNLNIAKCHLALKESASAIQFFYEALRANEGDIDIRLTLASLLIEENREDEAIKLLSPPLNAENRDADNSEKWWLGVKVKLKLCYLYKSRGMLEDFVEVIYPLVHDSLKIDSMHQKVKRRKRISKSELLERVKVLGDHQTDSVFGQFRRPASKSDVLKATRARRKLLEKSALLKEEKTSAAIDAESESESDDSEEEIPQQPLKTPPWPDFFKDEENYTLILDLCRALISLRRFSEALELITLSLKITYKTLSTEKKEKFQTLGAEIATNITDPSDGFGYVRYLVQQRPQSKAAWNCYYKLVLRLENRLSKHNKLLHHMRVGNKDLVPPMIISGNQFTMISQHQVAAREYLEAYKQMPESPLVNLCAGTALINLALGLRLQNKHQCVAQGLAFLYNNLRICENSQESLYNIARACHHVGLVSLAASYYEKVLAIRQEDLPLPEMIQMDKDPTRAPQPGYCDLGREAAFNLHLIYKNSGAVDLARQMLRNYCTFFADDDQPTIKPCYCNKYCDDDLPCTHNNNPPKVVLSKESTRSTVEPATAPTLEKKHQQDDFDEEDEEEIEYWYASYIRKFNRDKQRSRCISIGRKYK